MPLTATLGRIARDKLCKRSTEEALQDGDEYESIDDGSRASSIDLGDNAQTESGPGYGRRRSEAYQREFGEMPLQLLDVACRYISELLQRPCSCTRYPSRPAASRRRSWNAHRSCARRRPRPCRFSWNSPCWVDNGARNKEDSLRTTKRAGSSNLVATMEHFKRRYRVITRSYRAARKRSHLAVRALDGGYDGGASEPVGCHIRGHGRHKIRLVCLSI